ncbi:MAG: hypothetical protein ACUVUQ_11375 [Thermodesulfovibrionales bacterium]
MKRKTTTIDKMIEELHSFLSYAHNCLFDLQRLGVDTSLWRSIIVSLIMHINTLRVKEVRQ